MLPFFAVNISTISFPENLDINNASYQLVVVSSELLAAGLCSVLVYVHYLFKGGLSRCPRF